LEASTYDCEQGTCAVLLTRYRYIKPSEKKRKTVSSHYVISRTINPHPSFLPSTQSVHPYITSLDALELYTISTYLHITTMSTRTSREFERPVRIADREARESLPELDMQLCTSISTQNSSTSDLPSPVTPTFSTRGHLRNLSSVSSIESQYLSVFMESPSSPTFSSSKSGKRSLPDVKEELGEREEEYEDDDEETDCDELYNCLCKFVFLFTFLLICGVFLIAKQDSLERHG
jgi:hypothetical protein